MPKRWVVLLEAAPDHAYGRIDDHDLARLHEALEPGPYGGALHSRDRYALQVTVTSATPVDALLDVVRRWTAAVRLLGLPPWSLVRAEVFTPEDLEREFDEARRVEIGVHRPQNDPGPADRDDIGHELLHRAFSDPLTGLLGREAFAHRLEAVLGSRRSVAVVLLGLDDFEGVNDRFGRSAGDEVLSIQARRMAALLRPGDVLARLGGDEYGVLLDDCTEDVALVVAGRLLDAVCLPVSISGQRLTLVSSAGVALSHPDDGAEAVLGHAEAALAAAQAGGGGGLVLYGPDMSRTAQSDQHLRTAGLRSSCKTPRWRPARRTRFTRLLKW